MFEFFVPRAGAGQQWFAKHNASSQIRLGQSEGLTHKFFDCALCRNEIVPVSLTSQSRSSAAAINVGLYLTKYIDIITYRMPPHAAASCRQS
jgi:hypothetical protein